MISIKIEGHGNIETEAGLSLLEVCEEHDIPMECACGGFAACNSCRVRVLDGAEHLTPLLEEERPFLDRADHRLGCQAIVQGRVHVVLDSGM